MLQTKLRTASLITASFLVGTAAALGTTLALAHGGDASLIHACVKNGSLRIVGPNDICNQNETPLDWSQNATSSSESPISVGGGLSGRWVGTFTFPAGGACEFSDNLETLSFAANLVQDANGNLTGASKTQYDSNSDRPASVIFGEQTGNNIEFEMGNYNLLFSTASQDVNNMSGTVTYDPDPDGCNLQGTWSAQRSPLLP